jgi:hypothetical protein
LNAAYCCDFVSENSNPYLRLLKRVNITAIIEEADEVKDYFGLNGAGGMKSVLE